jgi:phage gp16-like protein
MKATRKQKAIIHMAKTRLGLDEDTYRAALRAVTGKDSAARLSVGEANRVIDHFVSRGFRIDSMDDRRQRFRDLADRPGMASPAQLRKIEAMWREIAWGDPSRSLRRFLFNGWRCSDLRFLTAEQAREVIEAIKKMVARRGK